MTKTCPHCGTTLSEFDASSSTVDIEYYDVFNTTRATVTIPCFECQESITMRVDVMNVSETDGDDSDETAGDEIEVNA